MIKLDPIRLVNLITTLEAGVQRRADGAESPTFRIVRRA